MLDLIRLVPFRNLRRQPLRSALAVVGAACGVALFVSIEVINASTLRYFAEGVRAMAGGSSLTVSASQAGFDQGVRNKVLEVRGVRAAVPSIEIVANILPREETEPVMLGVLGVDPDLETFVRTHRLERMAPGSASLRVLRQPNAVLLPAGYAEGRAGATGSRIHVSGQSGPERLVVAGTLDAAGATASGYALVGLETAQRVFGFDGRITRLDLVAEEGRDVDALAADVQAALGTSYVVQSSRARELDMQRMVRGYHAVLRFMSIATLLAGAMAIAATMSISVREQNRTLGILRALGASRSRLLALIVVEAGLLSAVASGIGVAAGDMAAERLIGAVTHALANTYMVPIRPATIGYPPQVAMLHGLFAWIVGLTAALATGARAARSDPASVIRSPGVSTQARSPGWLVAMGAAGVLMVIYLALVLLAGIDREEPGWQSANAAVGVLAALALAPVGAIASLRLLQRTRPGRALLDRAAALRLGVSNVLRAPGRSAWRVLLLSVGLLTFITVDTLHHSLFRSVENWLDRTVYSDLLIASPGRLFLMEVQPLNESVARDIDAVPGVRVDDGRGAMAIRYATIRHEGRDVTVKAFDPPHASLRRLPFDFRSGESLFNGGDIFTSRAALVSENFAKHFGKRPGEELRLESPSGPVALEVLGVVTDFASPVGVIYLPRDLYRDRWRDPLVSVFSVMVQPGIAPERVAEAIETRLGTQGVRATDNRALRRQMREILNESFAYTRAIEAAALIAAILGITNSMVAMVVASRREISLLRALGMSRAGVARMVVCEGLSLGIPASIAAVVLGFLLSYLCLVELGTVLMGWTLEFHVSLSTILIALALGALCGAAASAAAAWTGSRQSLSEGLVAY